MSNVKFNDIRLVAEQGPCTEEEAKLALEKNDGDIVNAILDVTPDGDIVNAILDVTPDGDIWDASPEPTVRRTGHPLLSDHSLLITAVDTTAHKSPKELWEIWQSELPQSIGADPEPLYYHIVDSSKLI